MSKIKKAIIPAAGLGTGFLPATKATAKEMLPIVDTPILQYVVEEAIESGIEELLIVTGRSKRSIEDHFDSNFELEKNLKEKGKLEMLEMVKETTDIQIHYVRQSYPKGLGDAVLQGKDFVGDEPFVVMLGDNIMQNHVPLTKQLIGRHERVQASVIGVMALPEDELSLYGVVEPGEELEPGLFPINHFVEKPSKEEAPSNLASIGRYILTPEIFPLLETQEPGANGEIQLTDAMERLNQTQRVFAHVYKGERFDVGEKIGYLKANLVFGLRHPQIKEDTQQYLKELANELRKR
ncbi:UTP--glucose-1-phosphate uridylyltransferase GalU [Atopococcus tabaci]|uniref:UTP--glucose-1-phosphate uridylyltransferase GalU n=1 Tax=Atopococcus tabaci TaxID=269774 RepID=UPI0004098AB6|nr:UTP--glucose-1-phosphate uridylyltransferase GalU [Atopococcus tabaci]